MMKKIIVFFLLLLISFSGQLNAQESSWELDGNLIYTRVSFADLNFHLQSRESYLNDVKFSHWDKNEYDFSTFDNLESALGFSAQGTYWLGASTGLGVELEHSFSGTTYRVENERGYELYRESYDLSLSGALLNFNYRLTPINNNLFLDFALGAGIYNANLNWDKDLEFSTVGDDQVVDQDSRSYDKNTLGLKGKIGAKILLREDISINFNIAYRRATFDRLTDQEGQGFSSIYLGEILEEKEFDFNSFIFALGLGTKF